MYLENQLPPTYQTGFGDQVKALKKSHPQNIVRFLKKPHSIICHNLELLWRKALFSRVFFLSKMIIRIIIIIVINSSNTLKLQLFEDVIADGENKSLVKNLKRRFRGWDVQRVIWHIPGNLEVHEHMQGCAYTQERQERSIIFPPWVSLRPC